MASSNEKTPDSRADLAGYPKWGVIANPRHTQTYINTTWVTAKPARRIVENSQRSFYDRYTTDCCPLALTCSCGRFRFREQTDGPVAGENPRRICKTN